jgi:hypothetical protein
MSVLESVDGPAYMLGGYVYLQGELRQGEVHSAVKVCIAPPR